MSRNRYRAKSKRVQKLGRDGLVEQDKATGEERRASQRAADISFGPDRTPDQGLARPAPAKGKKRRQHPPSSAGHIGGAAGLSPGLRGGGRYSGTAPAPGGGQRPVPETAATAAGAKAPAKYGRFCCTEPAGGRTAEP